MKQIVLVGTLAIASLVTTGCSGGGGGTFSPLAPGSSGDNSIPSTPSPIVTLAPTPKPTVAPTATPTVTPIVNPLNVTPAAISIGNTAPTTATFVASEAAYIGKFSIAASTCAGIASITPSSASGPSATFTVTQVTAGTCSVVVSDTRGQSKTVSISSTTNGAVISAIFRGFNNRA